MGGLGTEGARGAAAASWHAVYTALPMVLGAPSWLSATDRRRRDRLHGASASNGDNPGQEPLELASEPLLRACAQLTGAEPTAALTTLDAIAAPQRRAEHALIAVLAIRLAGADPASTARATAAWRDRFPGPLVRLLTSEPAAVETRLDELALDLEETSPDRWLFLLGATWLRSQRQPDLLGRLRAVGELMWLCGADSLAPFWLGALRAQLLPAQPASPGELAGLRALAASLPADDNPGAILLQSLLALHARDDRALDGLLATAPRPTDPALALLEFWSATTGEARVALQEALRGGRLPRRQDLAAGDRTAATVQAMHLWCNADASTEARRQQGWRAALASGADFALLPQARTRPANPTAMPSLVAVLQAHPRQDPAAMSPAFCAALRLCAGQGAELGSLARTYSQEISRGF